MTTQSAMDLPDAAAARREGPWAPLLDSLLLVARIEGKVSTATAVTAGLPLDEAA